MERGQAVRVAQGDAERRARRVEADLAHLLGEAIDYSIYLFVQAGEAGERGEQTWAQRFWPTVRLGVFTSIAGFSALLFSGLPGLVQLGLYASVGLVVAAAIATGLRILALVTGYMLPPWRSAGDEP